MFSFDLSKVLDLNGASGMVPNASEHGYGIDHMLQYWSRRSVP